MDDKFRLLQPFSQNGKRKEEKTVVPLRGRCQCAQ